MPTLLLLLAFWPFGHTHRPGQNHTRAYHAAHLSHLQASRAHRLTRRRHSEHASLIHF